MIAWFRALWSDLTADMRQRRDIDEYKAALERQQDELIREWAERRRRTR